MPDVRPPRPNRSRRSGRRTSPSMPRDFTTSGIPLKPVYDALPGDARALGEPGEFPLRARPLREHVPRTALDDAAVRRFRNRFGIERALSLPARARTDRPLGSLRPADAARLRFRRAAGARRSREGRRRDRFDCGHGNAVRRNPARSGHRLDDDQRAGFDPARAIARDGTPARHSVRKARRHRSKRRPQRVRRARDVHLSAAALDAPRYRRDGVLRARSACTGTRSRSPATTSAKPARPRSKNSPSRFPTPKRICAPRATADSISTASRRGSRSSGTRTTTSSKRSRSSARRALSLGPHYARRVWVRRTPVRRCCAFTPRPAARR